MFTQRYNVPATDNKYFSEQPFIYKIYDWGNCTSYCLGRTSESTSEMLGYDIPAKNHNGLSPTTPKPMFDTEIAPNAKDWYNRTKWPKGKISKVGSIVCYGEGEWSTLGHVMFVEQVNDDGTIVITEGGRSAKAGGVWQYGFMRRTVNPETACGDCSLQGYIYNPWLELQPVERDVTKHQVEVNTDYLRVRFHAGLDKKILGYCPMGYFNISKTKENIDGYRWFEIDENTNSYIAQVEGVLEHPIENNLEQRIVLLEMELKRKEKKLSEVLIKLEEIKKILI